ncbi:acyl-CoA dehydrogenase family protein [Flavobacteriaceae bacterium]|jgi:acyl-CoA dehydrogenase|nr:acyl-CoA dehydrogenase family protein [Flavobacteriaceae bacterium]MDB4163968.1 acyl-CoA dehydrogenase family protein [Flavobacteriaceae bacterium]MDB9794372.1 acyl-CoA dehydrogenase family protein [Flavobacteriaceae bacterium]MDB9853270.1 acyl-CoA dehydrogenase family protein [Flavobacteriaceae bacterium]MDB9994655.1 acyl-CoA dehydrogenase family protein [Flavobacteriaceae bacterium]|tara:strand:+ start:4363 stop:5502 length:1140 start_codon:yes stop_codon:yes gene_type:complete
MDFNLGPNVELVAESAKAFAEKFIRPNVMDWDESQYFPKELLKQAGEFGFMGVLVPESLGGSGLGYHEYVSIIEEISKVDPSIGLSVAAHNSLCTNHILLFGTDSQKNKWIPKLASGEHLGAWGLTENNSGSDASGMSSTAVKDGESWILNGTKNFITHGISGDVAVAIFRTGEKGEKRNATAFVIERGTNGFKSGKKENKLGMRASETAEMIFDNCIVSDDNRLGEVGEGFIQSMKILDGGRISIAALSLGIAKGAFNAALKYSKERVQFGKPISSFQGISFKLAEMATEIEASELLIHKASFEKNSNRPMTKLSAMCKMYASEVCVRAANESVQIHGGYGYIKDFPAEKFYRDSKLCTIGEGTTEIQKLVISRNILK